MAHEERLLDLLATRATEGLSGQETQELDRALRDSPEVEDDRLDLAAAAADLAFQAALAYPEPMPESLRRRVLEQARAHFDDRTSRALDRSQPTVAPSPTLAEQRALLIERASDVIQVAWAKPEIVDYAQVRGDVVWSNELQAGFMRLSGLPANRRDLEQYQLWIVDPSRDTHPTDGGVFDIPAGADEVIVPIDAKLRVDNPAVFAITLERTGGVVVSDGPLLVVAPVEA